MQLRTDLKRQLAEQIRIQGLPAEYIGTIENYVLPLAAKLFGLQGSKLTKAPLIIGVYGSQGSGKTTMVSFLRDILQQQFETSCVTMSLDDFYLTHTERQGLARKVHPLLATRGVPGTHDIALLTEILEALSSFSQETLFVPSFTKATDDRAPKEHWNEVSDQPSMIILEGWCVGVPPQPEGDLLEAVNHLEKDEDPDLIWRSYVNKALATDYAELFSSLDVLIALQAPSFDSVFDWRLLQERKLQERYENAQQSQLKIMSRQEVARFIQHYQRLTEYALKTVPAVADCVFELGSDHQITNVTMQKCLG